MSSQPFFSVIIPIRITNSYLRQTIKHLKKQSIKNFELLIITDKISKSANPAIKRNLGAQKARGKYLVFLDDDSFPGPNYLEKLFLLVKKHPDYAGFCGPCLTPYRDNAYQKASGLILSSYLGSGGGGLYRNLPQKSRFVDDYPSVNLIIKKTDFQKVNGFKTDYWPGEDTILCLDLVYKLNKKILYHPDLLVYHHRRSVFIPFLKQISRYALHRGFFVKKFPKNSLKLGYFIPSVFTLYLLTIPIHHFLAPLFIYLFSTVLTFFVFLYQQNSCLSSLLAVFTIPFVHLTYGIYFIYGIFLKKIDFSPHKVNIKTGDYIGG